MASVFLADIDDYLGPSQACVNPLFTNTGKKENESNSRKNDDHPEKNEAPKKIVGQRRSVVRRRRVNAPSPLSYEGSNSNSSDDFLKDGSTSATSVSTDAKERKNKREEEKEVARVSVADCLACSGCVTSAEAVLVESHSIETLKKKCLQEAEENPLIVFSVSPASLADLARHLEHPDDASQLLLAVSSFLGIHFGAAVIMDASLPLDASLEESVSEFCHSYCRSAHSEYSLPHNHKTNIMNSIPEAESSSQSFDFCTTPSIALSSTQTKYILRQQGPNSNNINDDSDSKDAIVLRHLPGRQEQKKPKEEDQNFHLNPWPIFSSTCPGFTCYVEKTAPSVVSHLSSVKSPMAIAGILFKHWLLPSLPATTDRLGNGHRMYHVAIMPCHDKKLEASRRDLAWEQLLLQSNNDLIPDIDLVLTTSELLELISQQAKASNVDQSLTRPMAAPHNEATSMELKDEHKQESNVLSAFLRSMPFSSNVQSVHSMQECCNALTGRLRNNETIKTEEDRKTLLLTRKPESATMTSGQQCDDAGDKAHDLQTLKQTPASETTIKENQNTPIHWWSGSGAYADTIFRRAASELFGFDIPNNVPLPWKSVDRRSNNKVRRRRKQVILQHQQQQRTEQNKNDKEEKYPTTIITSKSDLSSVALYRHRENGTFTLHIPNDTSKVDGIGVGNEYEIVLHFAMAYGFKNVQLLLQTIRDDNNKTKSLANDQNTMPKSLLSQQNANQYHYVEIMACPSGCLNGGGQIGSSIHHIGSTTGSMIERRETPAEIRERVMKTQILFDTIVPMKEQDWSLFNGMYGKPAMTKFEISDATNDKEDDKNEVRAETIMPTLLPSGPFGTEAKQLLHTRFHIVPKLELTTGATAGVALDDTKW